MARSTPTWNQRARKKKRKTPTWNEPAPAGSGPKAKTKPPLRPKAKPPLPAGPPKSRAQKAAGGLRKATQSKPAQAAQSAIGIQSSAETYASLAKPKNYGEEAPPPYPQQAQRQISTGTRRQRERKRRSVAVGKKRR